MNSESFDEFKEALKGETFQIFIINSTQKLSNNLFVPLYSFFFAKT